MIEAQRVARYVYAALSGDTGAGGVSTLVSGRIYRDVIPQGAALPALTITVASSVDVLTLEGTRVFASVLVDVRVTGEGADYGALNTVADRADAVLQGAGGLQVDAQVVKLRREAVQAFVEEDSGKLYSHIVATYRSEAHAA